MIILAFRNLFRQFRRTIAILLTVAMGSGALFGFQGFIDGVLADYRDNTIHAHYGYGQVNRRGYRDRAFEKPWKHWINNYNQLARFLRQRDEVIDLFPRVTFSALLTKGKVSVAGQGQGVNGTVEAAFFNSLNVEEGVTLSTQKEGILISRGLAKALNAHPGNTIIVMVQNNHGGASKKRLQVTGIFHTGLVDFDSKVFRIQLSEAQQLLKTDAVESVSLNLRDLDDCQSLAQTIEEHSPHLEAASFAELDKVYYQSSVDWLEAQFHIVQIIILIIVLLGISNSITSAILERKQELGNLRANGDSISDVIRLILCEGCFLGFFGALIGIGITYLIVKAILAQGILMPPGPGSRRQFYVCFIFTTQMVMHTLALSTIAAVAATFFAWLRVARISIADSLRSH